MKSLITIGCAITILVPPPLARAGEPFQDESAILAVSREDPTALRTKNKKEVTVADAVKVLTTYRVVTREQYMEYAHQFGAAGSVTLKGGVTYLWSIEPGYAAVVTPPRRGEPVYLLRPDLKVVPAAPPAKEGRPPPPMSKGRLDGNIPAADREKYNAVRDAKDWANPFLVVRAEGVEVISKSLPKGRVVVAAAEVRQSLVGLPAGTWPYGRVVAVQEFGTRSGGDVKRVEQNKRSTEAVLEELTVEINWWPSS